MFITMPGFRNVILAFTIFAAGPVLLAAAAQTAGANPAPNPPVQNPAEAAPDLSTAPAIQGLRPALDNVSTVIAGLSIARWKAPGDMRSSTQQDVDSIARDLSITLPPLLNQAQAPGALAPSFAVYRNVEALYDVLLRVSEMASLAGSADEASHLEDARAGLEAARGQLGNLLLQSVTAEDARMVQLRTAAPHASSSAPAAAPPARIVVDDGPAPSPKHKKKPAPKKAPPPQ